MKSAVQVQIIIIKKDCLGFFSFDRKESEPQKATAK